MTASEKKTADELLQTLAFETAASSSTFKGLCKLVTLPADSWQVKTIRESSFVSKVSTADELRAALADPASKFVLIVAGAMINQITLDKAIADCVLNKTVICEGDV